RICRAARVPRLLPHRHGLSDQPGRRPGAAGVHADPRSPGSARGVRGAASPLDERGKLPEARPRSTGTAANILRHHLRGGLYGGAPRGHAQEHAHEAVSRIMRLIAENILLFLLPTAMYLGYMLLTRRTASPPAAMFSEAPLVWLFVAGALLVGATLV